MPVKTAVAVVAAVALVAIAGLGVWALLSPPAEMDPVTVAWSPYESTALFWVAADQDFFGENGLCVTLRRYDTGAASLDGVVNGEADLAVGPTEYPLVRQAFRNASARAIACIDRGEFNYLVGRKDRGIGTAADLRGKRVGAARGTIAEFHLERYLDLRGMTLAEITLVDLQTPAEWVNAAADGEVDAVAVSQPFADEARDRLDGNAVVWPLQSDQPLFALVIADNHWLGANPVLGHRFLASLAEAEAYVEAYPSESREIVSRRLDFDPGYMETVWRQNRFSLSLDQSLLAAMKDEARWMITNNMTNATAIPDVRAYIDTTVLEQVNPGSVRIIG